MIGRLRLSNVGPFEGEHVVDLEGGPYAVLARHEGDPRRSNGLGKSMLVEAIRFAATGRWPARRGDADGWISRGAREGAVRLVLEDGSAIERGKVRGKARTATAWTPATGPGGAKGDDATIAFLRHLGLEDEAEAEETFYVAQKKADAFMLAGPGERLKVVSGWLGISSAERADAFGGEELEKAARRASACVEERDRARRDLEGIDAALVGAPELAQDGSARVDVFREAKAHAERAAGILGAALDAREVLRRWERAAEGGKAAREAIDALGPEDADLAEAKREHAEADAEFRGALKAERGARGVADGKFDGLCPVAGIACPAKGAINADRLASRRRHAEVKRALEVARGVAVAAEAKLARIEAAHARRIELSARVDAMREAWASGKGERAAAKISAKLGAQIVDSAGRNPDTGEPFTLDELIEGNDRELAAIAKGIEDAKVEARVMEQACARRAALAAQVEEAAKAAEDALEKRARIARARACVRAAQRRVAEKALGEIEEGANAALAEAGVPTRLRARWEREGKDLAKQCEDCGAAFPASAREKQCAGCGAARGWNAVQRLDLVADDSSGGLDDLAGAAWQHAAGAWLLRARQSPWSTAILDEVTAGLDHPSRRGLVRYLLSTVRMGQFRQLLMISHSAEVTEAFPRRIVVVGRAGKTSRIEVE